MALWVCCATSQVKKQLVKKYGQDFAAAASRNVDGCVNERVIQKLSVQVCFICPSWCLVYCLCLL